MIISIYSLDADYEDCAKEMGGRVRKYKSVDSIDVTFFTDDGVGFVQIDDEVIGFTSKTVGMTLARNEFAEIKIT